MQSLWGAKALTRWASQKWQGRLWQLALKPQGSLAHECNKGFVRALCVSQWYSYWDEDYHRRDVHSCNTCITSTHCDISPTSVGAMGHMLDVAMTIIVIIMVNASSASCVMTACHARGNNLYGQWRKYICIWWIHRANKFIYMNLYMWIHHYMNSCGIHIGFWFLPWACQVSFLE